MFYNLQGKTFEGNVRVVIRPGFGVRLVDEKTGEGRHVDGGPHDIPLTVAAHLLEDNKAYLVNDDDEPVLPDGTVVRFPEPEDQEDEGI